MADLDAGQALAPLLEEVFQRACSELAETVGAPVEATVSDGKRLQPEDLQRLGEAPGLLVTGALGGAVEGPVAFLLPQVDAARLAACTQREGPPALPAEDVALDEQAMAAVVFALARAGAAATTVCALGPGQQVQWPSEPTALHAQPLAAGAAAGAIEAVLGAGGALGWPVQLGEPLGVAVMVLLPTDVAGALAERAAVRGACSAGGLSAGQRSEWARLAPVRLPMRVVIARRQATLRELMQLAPGRVLPLEKRCDEALELYTSSKLVARGEAMIVDDRFGFRVGELAHGGAQASRPHKLVR